MLWLLFYFTGLFGIHAIPRFCFCFFYIISRNSDGSESDFAFSCKRLSVFVWNRFTHSTTAVSTLLPVLFLRALFFFGIRIHSNTTISIGHFLLFFLLQVQLRDAKYDIFISFHCAITLCISLCNNFFLSAVAFHLTPVLSQFTFILA